MAVKEVLMRIDVFERGAPYTAALAGQHVMMSFKDLYESLLMTGCISTGVWGGTQSLYKPSFYLVPDPINALIPAFDVGISRKDTKVEDFDTYTTFPEEGDLKVFYSIEPPSADTPWFVFVNAFMLPDIYWQMTTRRILAPNEPFCFFLVLSPAVKDDIALPWAKVSWGNGEWDIVFRPEMSPVVRWRGNPVTTLGGIAGDTWVSSSLFKFEGVVSTIAVLPVRGHAVFANARDWNPQRPQITSINPYILGKAGIEPLWQAGPIVIEGQGVSAFVGIPSLDFSQAGSLLLPPFPVLEMPRQPIGGVYPVPLLPTTLFQDIPLGGVANIPLAARVYGTGKPLGMLALSVVADRGSHVLLRLDYQNPYPQNFFELVALSLYCNPYLVPSRRSIGNLTEDFAVNEATIKVSENGAEADIVLYPKTPLQVLPVIDTDYYVELRVKWKDMKDKRQGLLFKGFVKEVHQEERTGVWGATQWRLRVVDVGQRLREIRGDGLYPPFDGWWVSEVFAFCLLKAGLHPAEFLHFFGNDFLLTPQLLWEQPRPPELPPPLLPEPPIAGFPYWWVIEKPRFTVKVGQSLWDFLQELALMSGNEVFTDGLGVWVIPSAYESPVPIYRLVDISEYGEPDRDVIMGDLWTVPVANLRLRAEPGWMPTTYLAIGKSPLGFPIYSFWELPRLIKDPTTPNFRGVRVAKTIADDKLATPMLAFRRAFYEYLTVFRATPLTVDLTLLDVPANPYIGLRDRVTVESKATADVWLSQIGVKPFPAHPQDFIVRQVTWSFRADPSKCVVDLSLRPPANIPYGLILPKLGA